MKRRSTWFNIRTPLSPGRAAAAKCAAFLMPLAVWSAISYLPFVAHPLVRITDHAVVDPVPSGTTYKPGDPVDRATFDAVNDHIRARNAAAPAAAAAGAVGLMAPPLGQGPLVPPSVLAPDLLTEPQAVGEPANPYWFPAPHEVAVAFYTSLTTKPTLPDIPWVHQSLWHSCQVIFWGFVFSAIIGVPLGVLCGTFDLFSKATEPFIDFIRYMPAPAFAAVCVAMLDNSDNHDGPKIAIIWIGTFFQMVLVVANTTRQFDLSLLEAAQTLGANRWSLITRVILPGILPNLYNDMRILVGWAWTYLIVAELIGIKSGISEFIDLNSKHFQFANVYAGIIMIGMIGLLFDQLLAYLARFLFPWQPNAAGGGLLAWLVRAVTYWPRRLLARSPQPAAAAADAAR